MGSARPHDSGHKHVAGTADYIDDMPEPAGILHAYLGLSQIARGEVEEMDLRAVKEAPGVMGVLTAKDLPGVNDIAPTRGKNDEPVFVEKEVRYWGQALFAVVATSRDAARRAARLGVVRYREEAPILDIDGAREAGGRVVTEGMILHRGDVVAALEGAELVLEGSVRMGGQDHFYLEGQIAMAVPGEDDDVTVYSSTQHPSEIQHMVAHVLGTHAHAVTVVTRRMGGGFGGKETQGNLFAVVAALAAKTFGRAVKIRPDRDDDMVITGKRHDFLVDYKVGFDREGRIGAVDAVFAARCGYSADLSGPVTDRALFHADNAYYYPAVRLRSEPLMTNTVSNTAFRGFGGPQGMVACERWIEEIAYRLGKDPLEVRKANFYGDGERSVTPYHQRVGDNVVGRIVGELEESAEYQARRREIVAFNRENRVVRRGIALTPVKFGISFTMTAYNQAGALVHVYRDGSVHLNHGATEMGQGVNIKVAQVLADAFGVGIERIKITATTTAQVPNTSATAASSGSDLNGMAAFDAARQIKERLVGFLAETYKVSEGCVVFGAERVEVDGRVIGWEELTEMAYINRVQLSAAGFYKTPSIHWDREAGRGNPFFYFAYGAACSEVAVDTLTGEYRVVRADILHDVGKSLNPAIDIGQVEGGFVQGMGWLTTEELWWDAKGRLRTHAPSTYKIPLATDVPEIFNVRLAEWSVNPAPTIGRSKAVGEPPFMLAISVLEALSMAAASVADYAIAPRLEAPATPERMLTAIERLRREAAA